MNWTGAANMPVLAGPSGNTIKVYGSLNFIAAMNLSFAGTFSFESITTGQTVFTAGKVFNSDVIFDGPTGSWALQDALTSTGTVFVNSGTFNTNNQTVNANGFTSSTTTPRTVNLGNSVFNLGGWYIDAFAFNITVNAGTSVVNISTGGFIGGNHTYYDINFASTNGYISDNNTIHNVYFAGDGMLIDKNTVNNLTFNKNGALYDDNTINNLSFTTGFNYILRNTKTQTITGTFTANGTCASIINIASSAGGSQAIISHPPGAVTVSFVALKDIVATGGATFTANNSTNLGNNTGWSFPASTSKNLYWIGNSGSWNDGNHWSLSSGGPPSGCAPTGIDNVFFDANSYTLAGQTTTIDITTAFCKNMDWTGAANTPTLGGPAANTLKIYGSLKFVTGMNLSFLGTVSFESATPGQTLLTAGRSFNYTVKFAGGGGSWTLLDAFNSTDYIELNAGTLNTNNQTVNLKGFVSSTLITRAINMGSSVFNIRSWSIDENAINITVNAGTSVMNISNGGIMGGNHTYYDANFLGGAGSISSKNTFRNVNFMFNGAIYDKCTITNLVFNQYGWLYDDNTITNLTFTAGYNYILRNAEIQTVSGTFTAVGTCELPINILTTISGSRATFSHPPGAVTLSYVSLKDIAATGGATFTANNSTDLGNNTGWTINPPTARNLYWIGNSGNWNDINHWSLTSGGAPISGCPPTGVDNVFFDANSFSLPGQFVTVNTTIAYCKSMSWTGATNNPTLAGGTNIDILKIFGSLNFIAAMGLDYNGTISFESSSAETVFTAGRTFKSVVAFNGLGGSWSLQDPFTTSAFGGLSLKAGTLTTNNFLITAGGFSSHSLIPRTINMGSSVFNLSSGWAVDIYEINLTVNAGTSVVNLVNGGYFEGGNAHTYYDLNILGNGGIGGNNTIRNVFFSGWGQLYNKNTVNNLTFSNDGWLFDNTTVNNLNFTGGYTYVFRENTVQTITGRWLIQGTCTNPITLRSQNAGSAADVVKTSGTVMGFNIQIKDIHCLGGATFNAYNSANLGGNSGWNFITLPPLSNAGTITGLTAVCAGQTGVVYHLSPTPGAITYNWTVPPGATITSNQGDTIITVSFVGASSGNVSVTASNGCATSVPGILPVSVNSGFLPSVSINTASTTICTGASVTFTASPTNGGSSPSYQWKVNGTNAGTNSPTFTTSSLLNGDQVTVVLTSSLSCASPSTATSNTVIITVTSAVTPAVSIAANPTGAVCFGTPVTFTANPVNTGGGTVNYNFKVNGSSVQNGSSNTFTSSTLINGNTVRCDITISGAGCLTTTSAISNTISMLVTPAVTPTVSVSASPSTTVCTGTLVTFTATAGNTGGGTVNYNFKVNGSGVQSGALNTFATSSLVNGNTVTCEISVSGGTCLATPTALSNTITMTVGSPVTPTVGISANPGNNICSGASVTFTAISGNTGGGTINYNFKVNSTSVQNGALNTFTTSTLTNGNTVECEISISGGTCLAASTAQSNIIAMTVGNTITPTVNITANPGNAICLGTSVTFTAAAANMGGGTVNYNFKVNGTSVQTGASNTFTTATLANGNTVTCEITISGGTCLTSSTVLSNSIVMAVATPITPGVNITANPGNSICLGALVTFNAGVTNIGGGTVNYDFKINGSSVQSGASNTFATSTLTNGNTVTCEISISGGTCLAASTAQSNIITMSVGPPATPTVSMIANPGNSICPGTTVTFTAGAAGIGGGTLQYDFRINGTIVQSGVSNTFVTSTLVNSDIVDCSILINGGTCISSNIAMSNTIVMQVNPSLAAGVTITANPAGTICPGVPITFSAASINGGSSPAYQWQLNGVPTGTNSSTFISSSLSNGDIVHVVLSSNAACVISATVISNPITVSVSPVATASVSIAADATTICPGTPVTFTATSLNGGSGPTYQWKVNGINAGTNSPIYINDQLKQGDVISCNMIANTVCSGIQSVNSNNLSITVKPVPVISFDPANPSIVSGNSVQLKAVVQGNISSYLWTPATSLSNAAIPNPVANPRATTTYNLHVVSQDNCVADKTITVLVYNDIYIPNSFTPDNNGVNDIFKIPPGTSLILQSFSIYDRYGNELFRTSNINEGWNGTYRGARSPLGTYTYIIKGTSQGRPVLLQGTVTIVR